MKSLCFYLSVVLLILPTMGHGVQGDDILGEWVVEGGLAIIEIAKKDDRYFGAIVALKEPNYLPSEREELAGTPRLDLNNQSESLRSRPLMGMELMSGFRFSEGEWVDGEIYDPENGSTYSCKISLAEDGTLHVRGYVGVSLLGCTTIWEPVQSYRKRELAFLGLSDCAADTNL